MVKDPVTGELLPVFDIHQHMSGPALDPDEDVRIRIDVMDRHSLDATCLMPPSGVFGSQVSMSSTNDRTAAAVQLAPGRIRAGLAHIDLSASPDETLLELDRAVLELGLRGPVWHHRFHGKYIDNSLMIPLLQACVRHDVPAFIHVIAGSGLEAPWRLARLLEAVPDVRVVALDAFSSADRAGDVLMLAERFPNLSCDLGAMSTVSGHALRLFLDRIGPARLLLGTDLYVKPLTYHFPAAVYEVLYLDISLQDKRRILHDNAVALLGLTSGANGAS